MNRFRGILVLLIVCVSTKMTFAQLIHASSINTSNAYRLTVNFEKLAILDWDNLLLYDTSNPFHPQYISTLALPTHPLDVDISDNYIYIAAGDSGVLIVDITTPTNPQIIGRFVDVSPTRDIIVQDTICYMMDYSQLTILNIAVPSAPVVITSHNLPMVRNDAIALIDNMIYVVGDAGEFEFLFEIDVTNPAAPFRRAYGFEMWNVSDMYIFDSRVFCVNTEYNYLHSYGIDDPDTLIFFNQLSLVEPTALAAVGDILCASRLDGGITLLECSNIDTTIVIDSIDTPGASHDIASVGNYLFVADSNSVQIYWLFIGDVNSDISLPESHTILANYPNPFNAQTTIEYSVEKPGKVTLEIYDILGRRVATPLSEYRPAGKRAVIWDASFLASGIYYAILRDGNHFSTHQMTLLK